MIALSAIAVSGLAVIASYQLGWLKRLPDPPWPVFDSERIVTSRRAYETLGIPDGLLGIASYGTTLGLACYDYARPTKASSLVLMAKIGVDLYEAMSHSISQWTHFRRICAWCLIPTACTLGTGLLAASVLRRELQSGGSTFRMFLGGHAQPLRTRPGRPASGLS